jgi:uncharacterized protein with HEPN domain
MQDKEKIEKIITLIGKTCELSSTSKKQFYDDLNLRAKVTLKLRLIGEIGESISKNLKKDYNDELIWSLFWLLKKWIIEDEDDTWDLLKGYSFKNEKYESLDVHSDILKRIWIAEYVLRKKNASPPDIHRITKSEVNNYPKKIIYTPMGNKR